MSYELPPQARGGAEEQLAALRDYLVRLAQELELAERGGTAAAGKAADAAREQNEQALREQAASLKALIVKNADDSWTPTAANCIENWGNNAIRLNVPSKAKTVYVEFTGEAGKTGYTAYNTSKAGWKLGFVALKTDGTRIYGDIGTATYAEPRKDRPTSWASPTTKAIPPPCASYAAQRMRTTTTAPFTT